MGCHTWFFTKSKYSLTELRTIWIKQQENQILEWKDVINNPANGYKSKYTARRLNKIKAENYPDSDAYFMAQVKCMEDVSNEFEWIVKIMERQLRMVKNGHIKEAFVNKINKSDEGKSYGLYKIVDGIVYVETDDMPHDIFRRGDYPEDKLTSLEQTLEYLETHKDKIYYSSVYTEDPLANKPQAIEELKEFWKNNPVGLIEFG